MVALESGQFVTVAITIGIVPLSRFVGEGIGLTLWMSCPSRFGIRVAVTIRIETTIPIIGRVTSCVITIVLGIGEAIIIGIAEILVYRRCQSVVDSVVAK